MRPRHLIHTDIFETLGGDDYIASLCRVEPGTVRKWRQNPEASGRDIPFAKFQDLLREAGAQINNLPLQHLIDELLQDHLLNLCHRRAILQDKAFEISAILLGQPVKKNEAVNG